MKKRYSVSEDEKKQFASAYLLDRMINGPLTFPLLLEDHDKDLEPILEYMLTRDYVEIKGHRYVPGSKGREVLLRFSRRYKDYLKNFDVFCAVDLESGNFAFEKWFEIEDDAVWDAYLEEERWEDLRVAVAAFKKLNPVEIVFMSFLNEKRFGNAGEGWQFDLLLGTVWDEILEICNSALCVADLAYEDDERNSISGEDVIKDVLSQGAELNLWIREEEEKEEEEEEEDEDEFGSRGHHGDDDSYVETVVVEEVSYDTYNAYYDPFYISPVWLALVFI